VRIRLELRVTPRTLRAGVAAVLLFCAVPELGSQVNESVAVTTFMPAPSGVYDSLITTQITYLATSTEWVTIAMGDNSDPGYKLYVNGNATTNASVTMATSYVSNGSITWGNGNNILNTNQGGTIDLGAWASGTGGGKNTVVGGTPYIDFHRPVVEDFSARIVNSADNRLDIRTKTGGVVLSLVNDKLSVGNITPVGQLDIGGEGILGSRAGLCTVTAATFGATTNCAAANTYATMVSGLLSRYGAPGHKGTGTFLCCPCPNGAACTTP
jgi:hypothetical protein